MRGLCAPRGAAGTPQWRKGTAPCGARVPSLLRCAVCVFPPCVRHTCGPLCDSARVALFLRAHTHRSTPHRGHTRAPHSAQPFHHCACPHRPGSPNVPALAPACLNTFVYALYKCICKIILLYTPLYYYNIPLNTFVYASILLYTRSAAPLIPGTVIPG